jgi:hypothetical protein
MRRWVLIFGLACPIPPGTGCRDRAIGDTCGDVGGEVNEHTWDQQGGYVGGAAPRSFLVQLLPPE